MSMSMSMSNLPTAGKIPNALAAPVPCEQKCL